MQPVATPMAASASRKCISKTLTPQHVSAVDSVCAKYAATPVRKELPAYDDQACHFERSINKSSLASGTGTHAKESETGENVASITYGVPVLPKVPLLPLHKVLANQSPAANIT